MENKSNLIELLEYINPATLDYQEWVNVGMALKHEGHTVEEWDLWSQDIKKANALENGILSMVQEHQ